MATIARNYQNKIQKVRRDTAPDIRDPTIEVVLQRIVRKTRPEQTRPNLASKGIQCLYSVKLARLNCAIDELAKKSVAVEILGFSEFVNCEQLQQCGAHRKDSPPQFKWCDAKHMETYAQNIFRGLHSGLQI